MTHQDLYGRAIRPNDYGHKAGNPTRLLRVIETGWDELRPPRPIIRVRPIGGEAWEAFVVRADHLSDFVIRGHYG